MKIMLLIFVPIIYELCWIFGSYQKFYYELYFEYTKKQMVIVYFVLLSVDYIVEFVYFLLMRKYFGNFSFVNSYNDIYEIFSNLAVFFVIYAFAQFGIFYLVDLIYENPYIHIISFVLCFILFCTMKLADASDTGLLQYQEKSASYKYENTIGGLEL